MIYLSRLHHRAERFVSEEVNVIASFAILQPDGVAMEERKELEGLRDRAFHLDDPVFLILDLSREVAEMKRVIILKAIFPSICCKIFEVQEGLT